MSKITQDNISKIQFEINLTCRRLNIGALGIPIIGNQIKTNDYNQIVDKLNEIKSNPRCAYTGALPNKVNLSNYIKQQELSTLSTIANQINDQIDLFKTVKTQDIKDNQFHQGGGAPNNYYDQTVAIDRGNKFRIGINCNHQERNSTDHSGTSSCDEYIVYGNLASPHFRFENNGSDAGANPGRQPNPADLKFDGAGKVCSGEVYFEKNISEIPNNNSWVLIINKSLCNHGEFGTMFFRIYVKRNGNELTARYMIGQTRGLGDWRKRLRTSWNAKSAITTFVG